MARQNQLAQVALACVFAKGCGLFRIGRLGHPWFHVAPLWLQTEGTAVRPFSVTLTNLAPGSWTFIVVAVNKNGRTAAGATTAVTVRGELPEKNWNGP